MSVGRPRTIARGTDGEIVHRAIVKAPTEGRVRVEGVNLDGDDQADRSVHGGPDTAVYAYAAGDTAWWSARLGHPLGPAVFGENGSRWRASSARGTRPRSSIVPSTA